MSVNGVGTPPPPIQPNQLNPLPVVQAQPQPAAATTPYYRRPVQSYYERATFPDDPAQAVLEQGNLARGVARDVNAEALNAFTNEKSLNAVVAGNDIVLRAPDGATQTLKDGRASAEQRQWINEYFGKNDQGAQRSGNYIVNSVPAEKFSAVTTGLSDLGARNIKVNNVQEGDVTVDHSSFGYINPKGQGSFVVGDSGETNVLADFGARQNKIDVNGTDQSNAFFTEYDGVKERTTAKLGKGGDYYGANLTKAESSFEFTDEDAPTPMKDYFAMMGGSGKVQTSKGASRIAATNTKAEIETRGVVNDVFVGAGDISVKGAGRQTTLFASQDADIKKLEDNIKVSDGGMVLKPMTQAAGPDGTVRTVVKEKDVKYYKDNWVPFMDKKETDKAGYMEAAQPQPSDFGMPGGGFGGGGGGGGSDMSPIVYLLLGALVGGAAGYGIASALNNDDDDGGDYDRYNYHNNDRFQSRFGLYS